MADVATRTIQQLPIDQVHPATDNPRRDDLGDLTELAASMQPHGVLQPLLVCPHPNGDGYLVVYGRRRRRAAALKAGLTTFPGEVRDRDDLEGLVEFEVRVGSDGDDEPAGCLLFDGELLTTGQGILVGSSLTDLHRVALPIGWYSIQINADQPHSPARFIVTLDGPRSDA